MAYSMTGFGRSAVEGDSGRITIEIRSVNHRYLDITSRMPRELNFLEPSLREGIGKRISRGKVDVSVSFEPNTDETVRLSYNPHIAESYVAAARQMEKDFSIENDLTVRDLISLPYVFDRVSTDSDEDALKALFQKGLDQALDAFVSARRTEGERLKDDLLQKTAELSAYVEAIEAKCPEIVSSYRKRLQERLAEYSAETGEVDPQRLAQEVTIFADKVAVDEEIVRLKSHIAETTATLKKDGEMGRRLDFLSQEMNREANTILSKSSDTDIDRVGVQMKTLIEKIREQIQNLE